MSEDARTALIATLCSCPSQPDEEYNNLNPNEYKNKLMPDFIS